MKIPHAGDFYAAPVGFPRASEVSNWVLRKLTRYRGEARGSIKQSGGFNPEPCAGAAGRLRLVGAGRMGFQFWSPGKLILKRSYLQTRSREVCGARCPLTKPQRMMSKKKEGEEVAGRSSAATRGTAAKRISVDATGEAAFTTTGRTRTGGEDVSPLQQEFFITVL